MFETDAIEAVFERSPSYAKKAVRKRWIFNSCILSLLFAVWGIGFYGIFVSGILSLFVLLDTWVHLRVLGQYSEWKKSKRFGLYLLWMIACSMVGTGLFQLAKIILHLK